MRRGDLSLARHSAQFAETAAPCPDAFTGPQELVAEARKAKARLEAQATLTTRAYKARGGSRRITFWEPFLRQGCWKRCKQYPRCLVLPQERMEQERSGQQGPPQREARNPICSLLTALRQQRRTAEVAPAPAPLLPLTRLPRSCPLRRLCPGPQATVRVRMPDGLLVQACFGVQEPVVRSITTCERDARGVVPQSSAQNATSGRGSALVAVWCSSLSDPLLLSTPPPLRRRRRCLRPTTQRDAELCVRVGGIDAPRAAPDVRPEFTGGRRPDWGAGEEASGAAEGGRAGGGGRGGDDAGGRGPGEGRAAEPRVGAGGAAARAGAVAEGGAGVRSRGAAMIDRRIMMDRLEKGCCGGGADRRVMAENARYWRCAAGAGRLECPID